MYQAENYKNNRFITIISDHNSEESDEERK